MTCGATAILEDPPQIPIKSNNASWNPDPRHCQVIRLEPCPRDLAEVSQAALLISDRGLPKGSIEFQVSHDAIPRPLR